MLDVLAFINIVLIPFLFERRVFARLVLPAPGVPVNNKHLILDVSAIQLSIN